MIMQDHNKAPDESWRDGVMTRMHVSRQTGAMQLCIFEQYCEPGLGAPSHEHAVEEVLEVLDGQARIWVDGDSADVVAGQSVLVPAGAIHGFKNTGRDTLHVRATLAAAIFEATYESKDELSRRYQPRATRAG